MHICIHGFSCIFSSNRILCCVIMLLKLGVHDDCNYNWWALIFCVHPGMSNIILISDMVIIDVHLKC